MTRELFEKRLREMQDDVLIMGSMVEKAIHRSVEALRTRDRDLSNAVITDDAAINAKRYEIEEKCIHTIALQQPMAADLRVLVAILFIATELERMADHAEGIGRINLMLGDESLPPPLTDIIEMGRMAGDMLRRSITAFVERDADAARLLCDEDDKIDALYDSSYHALIQQMIRVPVRCPDDHLPHLDVTQYRAHRRPGDEHLRAGDLHGHGTTGRDQRLPLLTAAPPHGTAHDCRH